LKVQLNLLCKETCDSIYRKTLALSQGFIMIQEILLFIIA